MPWIRIQGLKTDSDGKITAGTATIVDTIYAPGKKHHSKQVSREKLGRPLALSEDHRSGIFKSLEGGIVAYDANTDKKEILDMDDPRLEGLMDTVKLDVHTVFGDSYLFLNYLKKSGMIGILREVFPSESEFQKCIAHLYHTQMKNGSRDRCDLFVHKSFTSYVVPKTLNSSLACDTRYFEFMGEDSTRMAFFQSFVKHMREKDKDFGKCCYVDSTSLPNEIDDNPFNAFSSHGESGVQCRLVLVADIATGLPVWFKVIPGNVIDVSTLKDITDDVKLSLDVELCEYVLDAGYANEGLIQSFSLGDVEKSLVRINSNGKRIESVVIKDDPNLEGCDPPMRKIIVRMPHRKGYGHMDMFESVKDLLNNGKYDFVRNKHTYFGKRRDVCIFGKRMYAYIYIDQNNALKGYRDYISEHESDFSQLKDKEKTWKKYSSGFFVLLSNIREDPKDLLDKYFGRCFIETIFKTAKEYLKLLPLNKWTMQTVYGKLLSDMISTIIYLNMRKDIAGTEFALTDLPTLTQSLMCSLGKDGIVRVDPPNKKVKEAYRIFKINLPNQFKLEDFITNTLS